MATVIALAGCGGGDGDKQAAPRTVTVTTSAHTTTSRERHHYPPVLVRSYMNSCMKGNASKRAYCMCTLNKLSYDVSTEDFAEVGLAGGKLTPRFKRLIIKAAAACAAKL